MTQIPSQSSMLPDELLARLVAEFDDNAVRAIILHGSYARGDAKPPYSDIDLVRIMQETPEQTQQKRFIWRDGYLLNLSSRPLSVYREWLTMPEEAIFRVQTIREAHILLDKDGAFHTFQQEVLAWKWDPLQSAANRYVSQQMIELSEIVLRTFGILRTSDDVTLAQMIIDLISVLTEVVAVYYGLLLVGNSYFRQVQEAVGLNTAWVHYYMNIAGANTNVGSPLTMKEKGIAALLLYRETVQLLRSSLLLEHKETIEPLLDMITQGLQKDIS